MQVGEVFEGIEFVVMIIAIVAIIIFAICYTACEMSEHRERKRVKTGTLVSSFTPQFF